MGEGIASTDGQGIRVFSHHLPIERWLRVESRGFGFIAHGPNVLDKQRAPKTASCLNSGGMSEDRSWNVTVSAPAGHTVQVGILLVSEALEA